MAPQDQTQDLRQSQDLLEKFYSTDNLVTIEITMPDFGVLAAMEPAFGWRADGISNKGHRYEWMKTIKVTVSGTKFPTKKLEYSNVCIVKKSFGGSKDNMKPSFKLDFGRVLKADKSETSGTEARKNADSIRSQLGTSNLTLNNSVQDKSYVRQPLGYEVFRQAGVPYARCNFANILVNNKNQGIYVNLEPTREPWLQRNFKEIRGNLYETEARFDLEPSHLLPLDSKDGPPGFSQEGFSGFEDQKDLRLAVTQFDQSLQNPSLTDWKKFVDLDNVTRVLAIQMVIDHWDGYPNNTFVYNDTAAVKNPKPENVKLKLAPSGIDQTFGNHQDRDPGVLVQLVLGDKDAKAQLKEAIQDCAATFDKNLEANKKLVNKMVQLLRSTNALDFKAEFEPGVKDVFNFMDGVKANMATAQKNI